MVSIENSLETGLVYEVQASILLVFHLIDKSFEKWFVCISYGYKYIYICLNIYILKFKATKVRKKENKKHIFSYKCFDVFTKSSTVYMDQIVYKTIYSQQ